MRYLPPRLLRQRIRPVYLLARRPLRLSYLVTEFKLYIYPSHASSAAFHTSMPPKNKYTDPKLRDEVKDEIQKGDKGGAPGQWSARKVFIT